MTQAPVEDGLRKLSMIDDSHLDLVYRAARDAVEESIINAMLAGETSQAFKPEGMVVKAIDQQALLRVMDLYALKD